MRKLTKNGIHVGNFENKYGSNNPIYRLLMANFLRTIKHLLVVHRQDIHTACECGCGEGELSKYVLSFMDIEEFKAFDFSEEIISVAKENIKDKAINFYTKNIYDVDSKENAALIICCEVLEHLEYPERVLEKLSALDAKYYLFSVPDEPKWRMLNLLRGKYISQLGNTPGHIQHWSKNGFKKLIGEYFKVELVKSPTPWNIILATKVK